MSVAKVDSKEFGRADHDHRTKQGLMALGDPDDGVFGRQFGGFILDCGRLDLGGRVAICGPLGGLTYCILYLDRPNLLIRREAMGESTPKWDKVLAPLMAFSTLIISLASAVGVRITGVMTLPAWLLLVAFLCMTAGHIITIQSMRQNDYFEASVRIQKEYDPKVITTISH